MNIQIDVEARDKTASPSVLVAGNMAHLRDALAVQQAIEKLRADGVEVVLVDEIAQPPSRLDADLGQMKRYVEKLQMARPPKPAANLPYWRRFEKRTKYR